MQNRLISWISFIFFYLTYRLILVSLESSRLWRSALKIICLYNLKYIKGKVFSSLLLQVLGFLAFVNSWSLYRYSLSLISIAQKPSRQTSAGFFERRLQDIMPRPFCDLEQPVHANQPGLSSATFGSMCFISGIDGHQGIQNLGWICNVSICWVSASSPVFEGLDRCSCGLTLGAKG